MNSFYPNCSVNESKSKVTAPFEHSKNRVYIKGQFCEVALEISEERGVQIVISERPFSSCLSKRFLIEHASTLVLMFRKEFRIKSEIQSFDSNGVCLTIKPRSLFDHIRFSHFKTKYESEYVSKFATHHLANTLADIESTFQSENSNIVDFEKESHYRFYLKMVNLNDTGRSKRTDSSLSSAGESKVILFPGKSRTQAINEC